MRYNQAVMFHLAAEWIAMAAAWSTEPATPLHRWGILYREEIEEVRAWQAEDSRLPVDLNVLKERVRFAYRTLQPIEHMAY